MFFFFPQTLRISEKQLLLGIGESFVTFIGRYGYDVVLSALGMCLPPVCLFVCLLENLCLLYIQNLISDPFNITEIVF